MNAPPTQPDSAAEAALDVAVQYGVVLLDGDALGDTEHVYVQHLAMADLRPGNRVLLADGLVILEVVEVGEGGVVADVVSGGEVLDRKGTANEPDCDLIGDLWELFDILED